MTDHAGAGAHTADIHASHARAVYWRGSATHHAHSRRSLRPDESLLRRELGLLLGVCNLRGSLGLLALFPLSVVDCLRNRGATDAYHFHLGSFSLPGMDGAHKTALRLRGTLVSSKRDQRAARDPSDVFLLASRQVRRHLAPREGLADRTSG